MGKYGFVGIMILKAFFKRSMAALAVLGTLALPATAGAWGNEGHEVVAAIARSYLLPQVRDTVDRMLTADTDTLTAHDALTEATWADRYRDAGHKETSAWHFADIELDHPDLQDACFGFPAPGGPASQGPAQDCVVNKITEFALELGLPSTSAAERLLALKYLLHFVGDMHQPLHVGDNHDRGGNCVLVNLGGTRQVNLHAYWDTVVVQRLGQESGLSPNPQTVAANLVAGITPANKAAWEQGGPNTWALEGFEVARSTVYTLGSAPGCDPNRAPVSLPAGYDEAARKVAAVQLQKAGVRLALLLNRALETTLFGARAESAAGDFLPRTRALRP